MPRTLYKSFLLWTRTLHIYATMLALILLIFFSFTGFVLNHPTWFDTDNFVPIESTSKTPFPTTLAAGINDDRKHLNELLDQGPTAERKEEILALQKKIENRALQIADYLRSHEAARGEVTGFDDQDDPIRVHFTAPARKQDYTISLADGKIDLHDESRNTLAFLSDLHMGKGSGDSWRRFIDAASIFLMFAALSGLILWISLPKRRTLGLIALAVSLTLCAACYLWLMP